MAYKKPEPVLIDSRINDLKNSLASHLRTTVYRTCLNCREWEEGNETCKRFNARPPAPVIVYSCEQWEELADWEVPF